MPDKLIVELNDLVSPCLRAKAEEEGISLEQAAANALTRWALEGAR